MQDIKAVFWDFGGVITTSPFDSFNIYEKENNLAKDFNARGTPTIILENGELLAGYHSAKEILDLLKN